MSEVYNKIISKLQKLVEYQKYLKEIQKINKKEFVSDYHHYGLAERYLQLSIEVILDISKLIISTKSLQRPESNQEIFDVLVEQKIISEKLCNSLIGVVNFRNILVHDYEKIDRNIVYDNLKNKLEDFDNFAKLIKKYLKKF